MADFDGDGLLDLIVANRRSPLQIYRNVSRDTGHWIRLALRQTGGNRNAIGASVEVRTANGLQVLQKLIGGGHAGGQALPLHVGLGDAIEAQVRVIWPDGSTSETTLVAGRTISLRSDPVLIPIQRSVEVTFDAASSRKLLKLSRVDSAKPVDAMLHSGLNPMNQARKFKMLTGLNSTRL